MSLPRTSTILTIVYFISCLAYLSTTTGLLIKYRGNFIIQLRNVPLLLLHNFTLLFILTVYFLELLDHAPTSPFICCALSLAVSTIAYPVLALVNLFRMFQLTARYFFGVERDAEFKRALPRTPTNAYLSPYLPPLSPLSPLSPSLSVLSSPPLNTPTLPASTSLNLPLIPAESTRCKRWKFQKSWKRLGQRCLGKPWLQFTDGQLLATVLIMSVSFGAIYYFLDFKPKLEIFDGVNLSTCVPSPIVPTLICTTCVLAYFPLLALLARDAYGIHLEVTALGILWFLNIVIGHAVRFSSDNMRKAYFDNMMTNIFFLLAMHWIIIGLPLSECCYVMKVAIPLSLSSSSSSSSPGDCGDCGESCSLQMDWLSFERVLTNPELLTGLTNFAIRDFSVENVLFLRRMQVFRRNSHLTTLGSNKPTELLNEVRAIYREFFLSNALNELNVPDSIKNSIIAALEEGTKRIDVVVLAKIFDKAEKEIQRLVFNHTFPRFLQSCKNVKLDLTTTKR